MKKLEEMKKLFEKGGLFEVKAYCQHCNWLGSFDELLQGEDRHYPGSIRYGCPSCGDLSKLVSCHPKKEEVEQLINLFLKGVGNE